MKIPKTIDELQEGLKKKKYSATELVGHYIERIKKYDKKINSFLTVSEEYAYSKAKAVDKIISNNKNSFNEFPLLGAVVSHKDLFLTEGIRTTAGSRVLSSYVPSYSATVCKRIEKAGAIMIGKVNCDAWAHGASGENSDFGPTRNPWDTRFVPGGSSSGSAASVSSGFATFSTGTDTGGSVRQPASFNNLVGLKPTYGAVSRYGVVAMASSLDCVGHLTKSVRDSKTIFDVVRGEDGKDSTVVNSKFQFPNSKLRIGIPKEYFEGGIDDEVQKIVYSAIDVFRDAGYEIAEISLPHTKYGVATYYIIQTAETSSNLSRYDGVRYGESRDKFGDEAKRRIMLGTYVLSAGYYDAYYLRAMKVRSKIIEDFRNVFDLGSVDAIVAPVSPSPPFRLGERTSNPLKMYLSDILTVNASLAGIPSLAVPSGFSKNGLPIGFQIIGPKFSEYTLFKLGEFYQSQNNWIDKEPDLEE